MEQSITTNDTVDAMNHKPTNSSLLDNLIGTLYIQCPHSRHAMTPFIGNNESIESINGTVTRNGINGLKSLNKLKIPNVPNGVNGLNAVNGDHSEDQKTKSMDSESTNINGYCSWSGTINEYVSSHSKLCLFRGVSCPLLCMGCTAEPMIQKDLRQHFNHCNIDHLILISQKMELFETQQLQFQQYMKSTDSKITELVEALHRKNEMIDRLHTKLIGLDQDRLDEILEDLDSDTLRMAPINDGNDGNDGDEMNECNEMNQMISINEYNVQSTTLLDETPSNSEYLQNTKTVQNTKSSKAIKSSKTTKVTKSGTHNLIQSESNAFDLNGASSTMKQHEITLYGIGYNYGGELGVGEGVVSSLTKLPVSTFGEIKKIYRSYQSLYYLSVDGKLYCSGINGSGQLGLGPTEPIVDSPILNTNFEDEIAFVSSGCAATHCFVVTIKGTVYGFGSNSRGQLGIPRVSKVPPSQSAINGHRGNSKSRKNHRRNGNRNRNHQRTKAKTSSLLDETATDDGTTASKHCQFTPIEIRFGGKEFKEMSEMMLSDIQCGESHTLFLAGSDGTVWASGDNQYGQLGLGTDLKETEVPMQIKALKHIVQIHCGQNFSICVDIDGVVFVFGQNNVGQLGAGNSEIKKFSVPIKIPAFTAGKNTSIAMRSIKCGMNHICCLDKEGRAYTFGCNKYGRCGQPEEEKALFSPKLVDLKCTKGNGGDNGNDDDDEKAEEKNETEDNIVDIFCGNFHTVLLTEKGEYHCFGSNEYGHCSVKTEAKSITAPYRMTKKELGITGTIVSVVCGFDTTVLMVQSESV